ncbi:MAG: flagellin [SAR324 cluster bacterium]|nr:flagellin [SAR324 cluster bacterium]MCZ6842135.1 flagellin [SAR324 cluster bacterium]
MAFRINHNIPALNALRNLEKTDADMSRTLERLSSGLKVNRGADGPAVLVISEQMRGQIASIDQAIKNSESSISMVQTAEATLNEVNLLLVNVRQRAIHAANEGANDENMLLADQAEVENALDSIDRIARSSQFGTRTLFDGSNSTGGVAVGEGLAFVSANPDTKPSPADGYEVNITRPAMRAEIRGQRPIEVEDFEVPSGKEGEVKEFKITLSEGGKTITFSTESQADRKVINGLLASEGREPYLQIESQAQRGIQEYIAQRLSQMAREGGLKLDVFLDTEDAGDVEETGANRVLVVRHKKFGSEPTFTVTGSVAEILNDEPNMIEQPKPGRNVVGMIDNKLATGRGELLIAPNNTDAQGLIVKFNSTKLIKRRIPRFVETLSGNSIPNPEVRELEAMVLDEDGSRFLHKRQEDDFVIFTWEVPADVDEDTEGRVHVSQNSLSFQVGPTKDNQVRISLLNVNTQQLARGVLNENGFLNESGFASLRDVDVTDAQGALDTMLLVDEAISKISSLRANLGAFQRNTLESNANSLRISNENLTAAESSLRDANMAEEITNFTRNQIMLSAGMAMLAQANQTPQSVLQLLNSRPQ